MNTLLNRITSNFDKDSVLHIHFESDLNKFYVNIEHHLYHSECYISRKYIPASVDINLRWNSLISSICSAYQVLSQSFHTSLCCKLSWEALFYSNFYSFLKTYLMIISYSSTICVFQIVNVSLTKFV
jgi:hypothetical protein